MAICCPGVVVVCAVLTSYLGVTTAAGVVGNVAPYNYAEALHKALLYYQIQRSGTLPYQRLAWRSDSCTACKGQLQPAQAPRYSATVTAMMQGSCLTC